MNILSDIDLGQMIDMDACRLNLIYAILRITNSVFNKYLNETTLLLSEYFYQILKICDNHNNQNKYQLIIEQLKQDIDIFLDHVLKKRLS